MTPHDETLQALADLIGAEALAKLRAEFGGAQLYIPADNTPRVNRSPALRLRGVFSADVRPEVAVQTVISAAHALNRGGVTGLRIEVEAMGLGHGYAELLKQALADAGIKVVPTLRPL